MLAFQPTRWSPTEQTPTPEEVGDILQSVHRLPHYEKLRESALCVEWGDVHKQFKGDVGPMQTESSHSKKS